MKLDIIGRGGRKKDFWDIHALHDDYSNEEIISFCYERYPYGHSEGELRAGLVIFSHGMFCRDLYFSSLQF